MTKTKTTSPATMRERLPVTYLTTLSRRTGLSRHSVYCIVRDEETTHLAWPHIVKLAKEYEKQLEQERELGLAS